jgi:DnaJ-class molecular chaperone
LVFIVKQLPHERFTRDGNNLIMTQEVSLANSLMGVAVDVVTLDGRLLKIPVNDTISPDYTKTVSAEGMPIYKTKTRGNLLIKFITKFPTVLSEKQKRLLRLALV